MRDGIEAVFRCDGLPKRRRCAVWVDFESVGGAAGKPRSRAGEAPSGFSLEDSLKIFAPPLALLLPGT